MYLKQDEKHSTRQKGGEKFSMAVDDANLLSCDEKKSITHSLVAELKIETLQMHFSKLINS